MERTRTIATAIALGLGLSCSVTAQSKAPIPAASEEAPNDAPATPTSPSPARDVPAPIAPWAAEEAKRVGAQQVVLLAHPAIVESSGLASSTIHTETLWTHNDSGDGPRLFATSLDGTSLGTYRVQGAESQDWEDMASYVWEGQSYLVLGNVGGNNRAGWQPQLFVVREPDARSAEPAADGDADLTLDVVQRLPLALDDDPKNVKLDIEAVAVDPGDRSILMIEKTYTSAARVFRVAWPAEKDPQPLAVQEIARIRVPAATSMDISRDGLRALVGSYVALYEWVRDREETWSAAFERPPRRIAALPGAQYEAACYSADGRSVYMTREIQRSKGERTPLFRFSLDTEQSARKAASD